jgi:membrane protein implicated in regulation of membrane protease activity
MKVQPALKGFILDIAIFLVVAAVCGTLAVAGYSRTASLVLFAAFIYFVVTLPREFRRRFGRGRHE